MIDLIWFATDVVKAQVMTLIANKLVPTMEHSPGRAETIKKGHLDFSRVAFE